jgi:hypothetical protein
MLQTNSITGFPEFFSWFHRSKPRKLVYYHGWPKSHSDHSPQTLLLSFLWSFLTRGFCPQWLSSLQRVGRFLRRTFPLIHRNLLHLDSTFPDFLVFLLRV